MSKEPPDGPGPVSNRSGARDQQLGVTFDTSVPPPDFKAMLADREILDVMARIGVSAFTAPWQAVVVAGAVLEEELTTVLVGSTRRPERRRFRELLAPGRLQRLGFLEKALRLYSLGAIPETLLAELDRLARIRNAFGHGWRRDLSFDNPRIRSLVRDLHYPDVIEIAALMPGIEADEFHSVFELARADAPPPARWVLAVHITFIELRVIAGRVSPPDPPMTLAMLNARSPRARKPSPDALHDR